MGVGIFFRRVSTMCVLCLCVCARRRKKVLTDRASDDDNVRALEILDEGHRLFECRDLLWRLLASPHCLAKGSVDRAKGAGAEVVRYDDVRRVVGRVQLREDTVDQLVRYAPVALYGGLEDENGLGHDELAFVVVWAVCMCGVAERRLEKREVQVC